MGKCRPLIIPFCNFNDSNDLSSEWLTVVSTCIKDYTRLIFDKTFDTELKTKARLTNHSDDKSLESLR